MGREARRNHAAATSLTHGHQQPIRLTAAGLRDRQRLARPAGAAIMQILGMVKVPKGVIAVKETA